MSDIRRYEATEHRSVPPLHCDASAAGCRAVAVWAGLACLLLLPRPGEAEGPILLHDVTEKTGITFRHVHGGTGARYIMESVSAGLALFDYDSDGDVDIYFLNGAPLGGRRPEVPPRNALYRNDGEFRFVDVTDAAGVGDTGYGLGVAVGDYDNDGHQDIYINNYGPNVLYRNNGDGTFTDVTAAAGVANGRKVGAGTCFLDMDADGDLDLYVASYVKFSPETFVPVVERGIPRYPLPTDFPPEPDDLYRNEGDGTFTCVSEESGIAACAGTGMGTVCGDFDDDGDTDIFVCNDTGPNFLFQNDGRGKFQEVGLLAGVAYNVDGDEDASMGVDCGDYDNDGTLDLFMTDHWGQLPVLYRNLGGGLFEDATLVTGAGVGSFDHVNWGTGFVDFDNDGDRDVFMACGHTDDTVSLLDPTVRYEMPNTLLLNTGDGTFVNVSDQSGSGMSLKLVSRGTGFDDLDDDGDVDVVVLNLQQKPTILRNDSPGGNHWLEIRLRGRTSNRHGVGARVKVVAGDLTQIDEVHSGRGYQSHHGTRLHFGLGSRPQIDRIEVRWIGGGVDVVENPPFDRLLLITESGP